MRTMKSFFVRVDSYKGEGSKKQVSSDWISTHRRFTNTKNHHYYKEIHH
jgi:hypothetical protein